MAIGPKLLPGMFVRLRIPAKTVSNALLVPERVIATQQSNRVVYVVDQEQKAQLKVLKVGFLVGEMRVVYEGISAEDQVIVGGAQRLQPGMKVVVKQPESVQ